MGDDPEPWSSPTPGALRARAVADRLWTQAARGVPAGEANAVVDRLLTRIESGLRRWIGAEGYAALLARATAETLRSEPALAAVTDLLPDPPADRPAHPYTSAETQAAVVALLVTMMRHLGAIIGEEMAIRLVELSGTPSTRGPAGGASTPNSP